MLPVYLSYTFLLITTVGTVANAAAGKSIFLLAGQSNMSGRGGVINNTWDNYIPPESFPNLSILRLSADLNWQLATEPLHRDIDTTRICGIGPGMVFASSLLQKDSSIGVVGLVPCAVGGTNISEWAQGGELYKQLIKRAEAALEGGGIIRGLLWYQGESDTVNREDAEAYKTRLQNFFLHVRADLLLPVLPVIQVALASGEGPYLEIVREAQLGMDLVNLRTVDAKGLSLEPDGLHLTTPSQVSLGKMLANAFLQSRPSSLTNNQMGDLNQALPWKKWVIIGFGEDQMRLSKVAYSGTAFCLGHSVVMMSLLGSIKSEHWVVN
ncbi:probable carbohydrate esterase [Tanacetum coccineum]